MADNTKSIYIKDKSARTRITFTELSLYLIMLFPITTLMQTYISSINRLLFVLTFICTAMAILYKANRQTLFTGSVVLILYFWATLHTDFPLYNTNDYFYYAFWIIYVFFLSNKKELVDKILEKSKKYVTAIVGIWCALIAATMVMPSSYPYSYTYFKPYGVTGFRSAPTALFILALILVCIVYYKEKRYVFFSVFPMFVLFMGSSRTYFGIGVLLFAIIWYVVCDKTDKFFITAIPIAIAGAAFYQVSGISTKVEATTTWNEDMYMDYWATLTNGRSIFWEVDMEAFFSSSTINKILGNGFNFVYEVNEQNIGTAIWAHNDFIQVLTTFGVAGLVLYIVIYVYLCHSILFKNKPHISVIAFVLFFFVWLINAFFNMFYTYFCSCISYPLIAFALNRYFSQKGDGQFFEEKDKNKTIPHSKYIKKRN